MQAARARSPGDRIAVVVAGQPVRARRVRARRRRAAPSRLRAGATTSRSSRESVFIVRVRPTLRAAAFVRAWSDPSVAALIAVRGGYGSVQLLPLLDRWRAAAHAEAVHRLQRQHVAPVVADAAVRHRRAARADARRAAGAAAPPATTSASFSGAAAGRRARARAAPRRPRGRCAPARRRGPLFGGTLTQLAASLGTPFAFDPPDGCVLFLEDVNERPYRLDRLLTQLRLGGVLARARALVFGEMRGCDEPGGALDRARRHRAADRRFRRTRAVRVSLRPHDRPVLDAAARRARCASTPAPHPSVIVEESPVE